MPRASAEPSRKPELFCGHQEVRDGGPGSKARVGPSSEKCRRKARRPVFGVPTPAPSLRHRRGRNVRRTCSAPAHVHSSRSSLLHERGVVRTQGLMEGKAPPPSHPNKSKRTIQNSKPENTPPKKEELISQYTRRSSKLDLALLSPCSLTVGIPPMPSGLELEPNPGMDDHRFRRFCCLLASEDVVAVGDGAGVVSRVAALMLVLPDEPVVLGEL